MSDGAEAVTYETVISWADHVADVAQRLSRHFTRAEPRAHALAYVQGLLSPAERKNSWQLAEMMGASTPYHYRHLLGRARWDADAVRDELRRYVIDHVGTPDAVVVIDETGFLKKRDALRTVRSASFSPMPQRWGGQQRAPLVRLALAAHRQPSAGRKPASRCPHHPVDARKRG